MNRYRYAPLIDLEDLSGRDIVDIKITTPKGAHFVTTLIWYDAQRECAGEICSVPIENRFPKAFQAESDRERDWVYYRLNTRQWYYCTNAGQKIPLSIEYQNAYSVDAVSR